VLVLLDPLPLLELLVQVLVMVTAFTVAVLVLVLPQLLVLVLVLVVLAMATAFTVAVLVQVVLLAALLEATDTMVWVDLDTVRPIKEALFRRTKDPTTLPPELCKEPLPKVAAWLPLKDHLELRVPQDTVQ